jgi:glycosyltransferase involved in cell wall biosynthesis
MNDRSGSRGDPGASEAFERADEPGRVAVVADGLGALAGLTSTLAQMRERGVPGFDFDVIGSDAGVDDRLPAVHGIESPLHPGVRLGVPSPPALAEALRRRRYDLVHVCEPGPAGAAALPLARAIGLPVAGSYGTDLARAAAPGCGEGALEETLTAFYGRCDVVLSPSRAADRSLIALGIAPGLIHRWEPGVDPARFSPARYSPDALPAGTFNVLHVGRRTRESGIDLLADAVLIARDRDPRLHLVLAGGRSYEKRLRARLGSAATFLGRLEGDRMAAVYAGADLLVFPSVIDAFGQVVLEAQASGVPVLAVDEGAHVELIENGRSGCLVPADSATLATAIRCLARRAALCDRLATGGLLAVRERSWERSLQALASGWARAISSRASGHEVARAA